MLRSQGPDQVRPVLRFRSGAFKMTGGLYPKVVVMASMGPGAPSIGGASMG